HQRRWSDRAGGMVARGVVVAIHTDIGRDGGRTGNCNAIAELVAEAQPAGREVAFRLGDAKVVRVGLLTFPHGVEPQRRLHDHTLPRALSGEAAGHQPAMAGEYGRGRTGAGVVVNLRARHRQIEAHCLVEFPADIGARRPALALQMTAQSVGTEVAALIAAERTDQKLRRELARQADQDVELIALEVVADGAPVYTQAAEVEPRQPVTLRHIAGLRRAALLLIG